MSAISIIPYIGYNNAEIAIEWLSDAFGFQKHLVIKNEEGMVTHAELKSGNVMIMIGSQQMDNVYSSFTTHPGKINQLVTQAPYIVLENIEEHYTIAKAAKAIIAIDLKTKPHGGKSYSCYDIEGHLWNFGTYDPWNLINQ